MSKKDSDSEQSYCSDDSEFNYIPGPYVIEAIEVEEANSNEAALPTDDNLDPDMFNSYEDEPLASEEWLSEYVKKRETQADFERKLQNHYEGFVVSDCHASISVSVAMCHSPYLPFSLGVHVAYVTLNIFRTPRVSMVIRD